jgi:ABC-type phosphate transport system substrate-binding protein
MRKFTKLFTGVTSAVAAAILVAGTVTTAASAAPNDPPKGITPQAFDIVGVGSNTTQFVIDQISTLYNATVKTHNAKHPWLFSWDAVKPGTASNSKTNIIPKAGCTKIVRPNGSTAGLKAMIVNAKDKGFFCIDFGRSSGSRNPIAPPPGKNGTFYVEFAKDAITWATRAAGFGGSNAPASLNKAQLVSIFTCKATDWSMVGGKPGKIQVFLPQQGSGTLSTWEKFMGIDATKVPSCISQAPEENEGTFAGFKSPNAVFIYSIGAYVAQKFHSPICGHTPKKGQNAFGCDTTGVLTLKQISGKNPLAGHATNLGFPSAFFRTLFNIVRWSAVTVDHIDPRLNGIFGPKGFMCVNKNAKAQIVNYGFIVDPTCGKTS